jgi:hypothetical protein
LRALAFWIVPGMERAGWLQDGTGEARRIQARLPLSGSMVTGVTDMTVVTEASEMRGKVVRE